MNWIGIKDGDARAVALYRRHYSCRNPKIDYGRYGFSGKGESMVLLTLDCKALWCWRRVVGEGIYCSVFHNESDLLSSELIKEADMLAWQRWEENRHFTHVNPREVKGDGKCFKAAGWHKLKERTKKSHLIILEIFRGNEVESDIKEKVMSADTEWYVRVAKKTYEWVKVYAVTRVEADEKAAQLPGVLYTVDVKHWSEVEGDSGKGED